MTRSTRTRRPHRIALLASAAALTAFALPAGASAALAGGERDDVFLITGDGADDRVAAVANGASVAFDFGADGTVDRQVRMEDITDVVIELGPGTDSFSATGNLAPVPRWSVNGGPGPDRLLGTNGVDALIGGSGDDFIDAQQANDSVAAGTGADTVQWDPGDGSDSIDGGGDADLDASTSTARTAPRPSPSRTPAPVSGSPATSETSSCRWSEST